MRCQECLAKDKQQAKEQDEEEKRLLQILRLPDAWKCSCRGKLKVGLRAHAALYETHTEKCRLAPSYMGEQRWDGKNKGISREDLQFLYAREQRRW